MIINIVFFDNNEELGRINLIDLIKIFIIAILVKLCIKKMEVLS